MSEKPKRSWSQFRLSTAVVIFVVGGALLLGSISAIGRTREAAHRSESGRIMNAVGKAMLMYADVPTFNNSNPVHLGDLYPYYVADTRCFVRPGWESQEAGYIYIPGSTPGDSSNIVLYENPPESQAKAGRNVLLGSTDDVFMSEDEFQTRLKQTAASLKAKGIEMKPEPVKPAEIAKKRF